MSITNELREWASDSISYKTKFDDLTAIADRWELGMVKRPNNTGDGYFCWYSCGDTAANTPLWCMHKLANAGFTQIEQMMDDLRDMCAELYNTVDEVCVDDHLTCQDCPLQSEDASCGLNAIRRKLLELGVEVD